jgi:hypothetical protein
MLGLGRGVPVNLTVDWTYTPTDHSGVAGAPPIRGTGAPSGPLADDRPTFLVETVIHGLLALPLLLVAVGFVLLMEALR